jgi:glycosyltransferase involved in cell wall biosynthesis
MEKELSAEIMIKQSKPSCLSIIIPAFNEENYINRCLEAIKKMNNENMDLEIIVVDNGSTDKTVEISQSYGAKVLIKREGTIASLRNYGAKNSKGDLISFLDADCIVSEDWLSKALVYVRDKERIVIGFRLSIPTNSNWVAQSWDLLFSKRDTTSEVDWLPTGNIIMAREAFMVVNGFDETLESNEDYDFCFRLRNKGHEIISCADTSVIHLRPPKSLRDVFKKELWHGKEVFRVFYKDISQGKGLNPYRKKNVKVILYAGVYLLFVIFILFCAILAIRTKILIPIGVALILPFLISFTLAMKYIKSTKKLDMVLGLTVLLTVYGFARAASLLSLNKRGKSFS